MPCLPQPQPLTRRTLGAWLGAAGASAGGGAWAIGPADLALPEPLRVATAARDDDLRYDFPLRLLEDALAAAGRPVRMVGTLGLNQTQVADALARGLLDVTILPTSGLRQADLTPVRFPIRRGLLGARLLLALRERHAALRRVRDLSTLKRQFTLGFGADWHDLGMLQRLGFRIKTYSDYGEVFRALRRGEVDYLSRSVSEVFGELAHPSLVPLGIDVVPELALFYPLDDYFYAGPAGRPWLEPLQRGLTRLRETGAYQRLFAETYGDAVHRADFGKRRVLQVVGYGVEPGTPLDDFDAVAVRPAAAHFQAP